MFGIHDFGIFLVACVALTLTPGQDTFYILGRSIAQGRRAGIASVLGVASGVLVHTLAAAAGLSTLIATSAYAFLLIKFAGAAYLLYLGIRMLVDRSGGSFLPTDLGDAGFAGAYRQGLFTNLLNPKVALFFLAFMPQFIAADASHKLMGFVTLGLCFVAIGATWCFCLAWFASQVGDRLRGNGSFATTLNRTAGALFIALGVRLATSR